MSLLAIRRGANKVKIGAATVVAEGFEAHARQLWELGAQVRLLGYGAQIAAIPPGIPIFHLHIHIHMR